VHVINYNKWWWEIKFWNGGFLGMVIKHLLNKAMLNKTSFNLGDDLLSYTSW